jgi:hypothetical protein
VLSGCQSCRCFPRQPGCGIPANRISFCLFKSGKLRRTTLITKKPAVAWTASMRASLFIALVVASSASIHAPKRCSPWPLCDPTSSPMTQRSPPTFTAQFNTTAGGFAVFVNRTWSPNGADRFYNLVRLGFFNDTGLFRMLPGFVIEWGLSGSPALSQVYCNDETCPNFVPGAAIPADPLVPGAPLNTQPGTVAYSLMDGGAAGLVNASTEM